MDKNLDVKLADLKVAKMVVELDDMTVGMMVIAMATMKAAWKAYRKVEH